MTCLIDYIGLKHCSNEVPESGLYVNILPGISTELADKIANSEQVNLKGVYTDVQTRAFLRLQSDIVALMSQTMNFNHIVYQTRKPKLSQPKKIQLASENWIGVYVLLPESRYSAFRLGKIYVFSTGVVNDVPLKVFSTEDATELYSTTVALVEGFNEIEVNQLFALRYGLLQLFIAIDSTTVELVKFRYTWKDYDDLFAWFTCEDYPANVDDLEIRSAYLPTSDFAYKENVKITGNHLMGVQADVLCSYESFICENKQFFKTPLWYLLGVELLTEKLSTTRQNFFANTDKKGTMQLIEGFESLYEQELKKVVDAIPLTGESICFDCDNKPGIRYESII